MPIPVVMSAAMEPGLDNSGDKRDGDYSFKMPQPIPSYLLAIGAGDLVFKPRDEMGGEGVVIFTDADQDERADALAEVEEEPERFIAQERVTLSTHPTVCDGRLEPRHVDLRPYVLVPDDGPWVYPGGLARVALEEGSLIVNSGQGGGAKDTWVV